MKLHKQTKLKAALAALAGALLLAFLGVVRAEPSVNVEAETPSTPTPDYGQFFGPRRDPAPPPVTSQPPIHTRSRAS